MLNYNVLWQSNFLALESIMGRSPPVKKFRQPLQNPGAKVINTSPKKIESHHNITTGCWLPELFLGEIENT